VSVIAEHIEQESFWKRACFNRWKKNFKSIQLEFHGMSWKIAYIERHVQEFLQNLDATDDTEKKQLIKEELQVCSPWVSTLQIIKMNTTLDFKCILQQLQVLNSLTVTFGKKNEGINYTREAQGIKLADAANIGEAVKSHHNLVTSSPLSYIPPACPLSSLDHD